jgi:hypothetical protein
MRGGSAKYGDVDAVWQLVELGTNDLELRCTAKRFEIAPESMIVSVRRELSPLRHQADGTRFGAFDRAVAACLAAAREQGLDEGIGYRKLAAATGVPVRVARQAVKRRGGGQMRGW